VNDLEHFLGAVFALTATVIVFGHGWDLFKDLVSDRDR
jgi:hypothetical protein